MVEFSGEYGNTWVFGTLGLRYPWIFGTLVLTYSWILGLLGVRNPGTLGSSESSKPPVSFCRFPWIFGFYRCLALPGTGGVRRSKGANLDLWIFGFSVPSEIRYPLVGALGSSDSIGAWRRRVPMESKDPWVPSVYWGSMRVVWFFRVSAGA